MFSVCRAGDDSLACLSSRRRPVATATLGTIRELTESHHSSRSLPGGAAVTGRGVGSAPAATILCKAARSTSPTPPVVRARAIQSPVQPDSYQSVRFREVLVLTCIILQVLVNLPSSASSTVRSPGWPTAESSGSSTLPIVCMRDADRAKNPLSRCVVVAVISVERVTNIATDSV